MRYICHSFGIAGTTFLFDELVKRHPDIKPRTVRGEVSKGINRSAAWLAMHSPAINCIQRLLLT